MNYTNLIEKDNTIILENVRDFNIKQILECGQCFRWERISDTNYVIIAYRRVIEVIQNGSTVTIINTNMKDFNEIWKNYFDLNVDYEKIKEELSKDELLRKSVEFGYGIRILNQDPFEMLISFIYLIIKIINCLKNDFFLLAILLLFPFLAIFGTTGSLSS